MQVNAGLLEISEQLKQLRTALGKLVPRKKNAASLF
jgi:hypothetical protein